MVKMVKSAAYRVKIAGDTVKITAGTGTVMIIVEIEENRVFDRVKTLKLFYQNPTFRFVNIRVTLMYRFLPSECSLF